MKQRRIAIFLPSLRGGGAERVIVNLLHGFVARGVTVDLVLAKAEGPYLEQVPAAVRIIDLKVGRVMACLPGLVRYLKNEHPHALLAVMDHCNIVAILAKMIANVSTKVILSIHTTVSQSAQKSSLIKDKVIINMIKLLYCKSKAIIAVSEGVADDLRRIVNLPDKIKVIYNPVISEMMFNKSMERPDHNWFYDKNYNVIISVGRLVASKDFQTLILAFNKVRKNTQVKLIIFGEGELRAELMSLVAKLGLADSVCLFGFTKNPYANIAAASVFVLSSRYEGLPTVLIEAVALGTPVVATDCKSGPREIFARTNTGRLVAVGDVDGMAQAIREALLEGRPAQVPAAAWNDFSFEVATERYLELLG